MSLTLVFLSYMVAAGVALLLLYIMRARSWYWHVLSVLVGLVIGLVPIPESLQTQEGTLAIGFVFTFLIVWGIAAPFFRRRAQPQEMHGD